MKESSGGGVGHVSKEGSVAGCPHYVGMREAGAVRKNDQGKSRDSSECKAIRKIRQHFDCNRYDFCSVYSSAFALNA